MKRSIAISVVLTMLLVTAPGCSQQAAAPEAPGPGIELSIVSTIFPQYDWVRQILGDEAGHHNLALLMDSRIDLHSYQPSVSDIVKIAASDLFIHVGGVSDEWVDDVLRQATNPDMIVINLIDVLGDAVRMDTPIEGAQGYGDCGEDDCDGDGHHHNHGHSHDHNGGHDDDGDHHHEHEDEHVWLSLRNAKVICEAIAEALAALSPDSAEKYQNNLAAYIEKLSALDAEYQAAVNAASVRALLFADRFPFRYLMEDYGLGFYAAFSGCSAEAEASFSTIVFLAAKVDELGLSNVVVTESADRSIARTVISSTAEKNQQILVLNAMQSVTQSDIQNGAEYLSVMESNLDVLKEALK